MSVPHMLHRIWLGPNRPAIFDDYWRGWKKLHPGWTFSTWSDEDFGWLQNRRAFEEAACPAEAADIARYEILLRLGGVYVDTDVEPLRCIEPLLEDVSAFSAYEDEHKNVGIAILGAQPGHPFFAAIVERLPANVAACRGAPTNRRTGPYYLMEVLRDFPDVTLFPASTFYPYGWNEPDPGVYPDAFAVHRWAKSWA